MLYSLLTQFYLQTDLFYQGQNNSFFLFLFLFLLINFIFKFYFNLFYLFYFYFILFFNFILFYFIFIYKIRSPEGELACFLDAVLDVNGRETHVFVTHFGNTEDYLDRELQSKEMAEIVATTKGPIIVLGYFVAHRGDYNYNVITSTGLNDTSLSSDRYCHYIFYRDIAFSEFLRFSTGVISDTELQVAHFYSDGRAPSEDLIVKNNYYKGFNHVATTVQMEAKEDQEDSPKEEQINESENEQINSENNEQIGSPQINEQDGVDAPKEEQINESENEQINSENSDQIGSPQINEQDPPKEEEIIN